ncbi:FHA domain-containing protein [Myxococcota bacterium]|nr:FHA domain-containing protein [Myxococcota bacterium]
MGIIKQLESATSYPVPGRALVGRSPTAFLRIDRPYVSAEHAILQWRAGAWTIRDLGSRNGTFVDGVRLEAGTAVTVTPGVPIAFGDLKERWTIDRDDPPELMAIELASRDVRIAEQGLLALPSESAPELSIYAGRDGTWALEPEDGAAQTVVDQQVVYAGGLAWSLCLPEPDESTPLIEADLALENVGFRFGVSANEEHVELSIIHRGKPIKLETREHNYVLLLLARARLADQERSPAERGWVELRELLKMLKMRANTLAVAVHRARRTLAAAGVVGAPNIVEMRRRQRRFGSDRIEIGPL